MFTIGLNVIVGEGRAKELDTCLSSIAPHVDQLVVVSTAKDHEPIRKVVEKYGGECHEFEWCDDFAAARNEALRHTTTDWMVWADSDDEIRDAELLHRVVAEAEEHIGGFWLPYHYDADEYGNTNTLHDRERLVRLKDGWRWEGRLHEVLVPSRSIHWKRDERVRWIHHIAERGEDRGERNLRILHRWLADEPMNIRLWLHVASEYFAAGDWLNAAKWYMRFYTFSDGDLVGLPTDRWYAMCYAARAHRELRNFRSASLADMGAIRLFPQWADGYIGMAETMLMSGNAKHSIEWGEQAVSIYERNGPPDRIIFSNPLDYSYRVWDILQAAYAEDEQFEKAVAACEKALEVRPNEPHLLANRQAFLDLAPLKDQAEAYAKVAKDAGLAALALTDYLPQPVVESKQARDVWVPELIRVAERGTQPVIRFFCGDSLETWDGRTPYERGIGGSETAVVEVAKRLAKEGFQPIVYNKCGAGEGTHEGVLYTDWQRFRPDAASEVLVSWRRAALSRERPNTEHLWLWMHDLNIANQLTPEFANGFERIMGVSEWHSNYLRKCYPFAADKVGFLPNGIDLSRFDVSHAERTRYRTVYASSPDRGLAHLLAWWPAIRHFEPAAELHIFYGWENFERAIDMGLLHYRNVMDNIKALGKQEGVVWRGRVNQYELAREMLEADCWFYPTSFLETFCLTAVEAQAAGLQIVTSACGNLPNVVGPSGWTIPGQVSSELYRNTFVDYATTMLVDVETRNAFKGKGPEHAKNFTWEKAMERWLDMLRVKVAA